MDEIDFRERDIDKISKSWELAMQFSKERLQKVRKLQGTELDAAVHEGRLVLETICLFVHSSVRGGQFRLPPEFWRILHAEYGILVFPSALTEPIDLHGLNSEKTFTDCYQGHIVMLGRCCSDHPPPCPFEYLCEPPPVYQRYISEEESDEGCDEGCEQCAPAGL